MFIHFLGLLPSYNIVKGCVYTSVILNDFTWVPLKRNLYLLFGPLGITGISEDVTKCFVHRKQNQLSPYENQKKEIQSMLSAASRKDCKTKSFLNRA